MEKLKEIRVVRCLVDTEVSIENAIYEEYFDNPGYFYLINEYQPTGLGLPFDLKEDHLGYSKENSWIDAGMVEVIEKIHFTKSKWFLIVKEQYEEKLKELQIKHDQILQELKLTESIVNAFN